MGGPADSGHLVRSVTKEWTMTYRNDLQSLKTLAKRLARMKRIAHHEALDFIASDLGQPHWNSLTAAWRKGWRPEQTALESLLGSSDAAGQDDTVTPIFGKACGVENNGSIDGHPYTLNIDLEVVMAGRGWSICVEHAPSEKPVIERYDNREDNPVLNPEFVSKALVICNAAAEELRGHIAADWPRRSTKPDAEGRTAHPLFDRGLSNEWHCLHCEGAFSGAQMAANMWHCPKCSATPLDIFASPFWKAAS